MTTKKQKYLFVIIIGILIATSLVIWNKYASKTKIALVNFQTFQFSNISLANSDKFIKFEEVHIDNIKKLEKYDFILIFGMGLKIDENQRAFITKLIENKVPIYTRSATNPINNFNTLSEENSKAIAEYLNNGNKTNYQNMARYIRKDINNKKLFTTEPEPASEHITDAYFHIDEDVAFKSITDFEEYLKSINAYQADAKKIAVLSGIHYPFSGNKAHIDSLISALQKKNFNVYPISTNQKRLEFLEDINPDAIIFFPSGRLLGSNPDRAVEWLKGKNIPLFAPLTILQLEEDWRKNPMGMFGGFMGQTVVIPEIDGAIYPYSLVAQEKNKDNIYLFKAIPERLTDFTDIVANTLNLKELNNKDKKLAIYYFKGPGQEALEAQGLETVPSLFNFLKRLQKEGYTIKNLPNSVQAFEKLLMTQGAVLETYAKGAFDDFFKNGNPHLIKKEDYELWAEKSLTKEAYQSVVETYGEAPGSYMNVEKDGEKFVAISRIDLGNIVLLPQAMAALGDDEFAIVHGADMPPPHTYIGSYLWVQNDFKADALIHFGTHGSLEFTPQKQVALDNDDWADRMVGTIPHFYYYTIGNVGESMMAKRRSYATVISYLTQPFTESKTRSQFYKLQEKIREYYKTEEDEPAHIKYSLEVKKIAVEMGLHRELRMDSVLTNPYSFEEVEKIENFAEEIANERMSGLLYTSGEPYSKDMIHSSVVAMSTDPIAFGLSTLDKVRGKVTDDDLKKNVFFSRNYLTPAKELVEQVLKGKPVNEEVICQIGEISKEELALAKEILSPKMPTMAMRRGRSDEKPVEYSKEDKEKARAISTLENTIYNITKYKKALEESPELEFKAMLNALSGGYISPSSGGDAVANPQAVPTGHNLYSINAETTPTELAWDRGVKLAQSTLNDYKKRHGEYPRKVSYTFWSSEFIESEGTTIAQVFYMLGVEPVRDVFGRVSDLRLISTKELGRPRIDVVVQTSGQFRDLAASRLMLISKAVEMAAQAKDDDFENLVSKSTIDIERQLVEQGISPKDAREMSTKRIFGGINGMYGTGIQEMITASDKWENEDEIAEVYMHNMGADYGSDKEWGEFYEGLFKTVLENTDVVVQPRQNNTWGALSLDHVYEFMGGMNLAIRNVTGKDPEAYFADYRNRNRAKIQELKEAIGVESRTTVLNPEYVKDIMKGGSGTAAQITEIVTNTFGWNVAKPDVIDNELWDDLYDVYVQDKFGLGTKEHFKKINPTVLQEVTAIMLETVRKGMWNATDEQIENMAALHTEMVKEFGNTGSGFSGSNEKLHQFIAQKLPEAESQQYTQQIQAMKQTHTEAVENGMVLKKEEFSQSQNSSKTTLNGAITVGAILLVFIILLVILRQKRKNSR